MGSRGLLGGVGGVQVAQVARVSISRKDWGTLLIRF